MRSIPKRLLSTVATIGVIASLVLMSVPAPAQSVSDTVVIRGIVRQVDHERRIIVIRRHDGTRFRGKVLKGSPIRVDPSGREVSLRYVARGHVVSLRVESGTHRVSKVRVRERDPITPAVSPSPTPLVSPSPTPLVSPSPTPSASPTVSPSPTPSASPTVSPSPTPPAAPRHLVATQGPTDPANLYVMLTWDRSDVTATAYEVIRDGSVVATVGVSGDAWDDCDFKDTDVSPSTTYDYRVRALYPDGTASAPSSPTRLYVRSDRDFGRVYDVDGYQGNDREKIEAAILAAKTAGGGVVQLQARTYVLDRTIYIEDATNIVVRGTGTATTFVEPGFAGAPDAAAPAMLFRVRGRLSALGVSLTAPISPGDRTAQLSSTAGLAPGDVVQLDQAHDQQDPGAMASAGVIQDPGTPNDRRYNWDANEITSVSGSTVTFRFPFSQPFTTSVVLQRVDSGRNIVFEQLTLQGRSESEQTYYRLVDFYRSARVHVADVRGRWSNTNYFRIRDTYDATVVGFDGPYGGPAGIGAGAKYKFSIFFASNVHLVDLEMGMESRDDNQSYVTLQFAQRVLVRNSRFHRSHTYAINEHGGGGRDHVYENNYITNSPTQGAAIWLGNTTWGFSGSTIIRNNTFEDNYRDLYLTENSYEVRFLDNVSRRCRNVCIYGYGWQSPDTPSHLHGSLRLVVAGNQWHDAAGYGIALGADVSPWYPYLGVRDVIIEGNHIDTAQRAIWLRGNSSVTHRFQVTNNSGSDEYVVPPFVEGDHWEGNADGLTYGQSYDVDWDSRHFDWQLTTSK